MLVQRPVLEDALRSEPGQVEDRSQIEDPFRQITADRRRLLESVS
jgi:hypothetical protein